MAALGFSRQILTVDSGDTKADAIIVLGGGSNQLRPERAAELFRKGLAPLVVVSGTGDDQLNALALERNGVPKSAIVIEGRSKSTLQNARFSIDILRQKDVHRAIIVTSWYHSRRALQCFEQLGPDIHFASCPSYWGYPFLDWTARGVIGYVVYEYVKLLGYWVCYGIRPF
jgi:uncharacterized SAM-binding protein YcdF (DUF218 family)